MHAPLYSRYPCIIEGLALPYKNGWDQPASHTTELCMALRYERDVFPPRAQRTRCVIEWRPYIAIYLSFPLVNLFRLAHRSR